MIVRRTQHCVHKEAEAQHLAEHVKLPPLAILVDGGQHGLGHLTDGAGDERVAHLVPLGCLGIVAHGLCAEQPAKDERQHVVAHLVDDVRYQNLAAEAEHLADGRHINPQRRQPAYIVQAAQVYHTHIGKLLPGQAPVGVAQQGQRDAYAAAAQQGQRVHDGLLAVHHVAEHIG